jgi:3D (Asp-Asp-Asp) domain-containing protein
MKAIRLLLCTCLLSTACGAPQTVLDPIAQTLVEQETDKPQAADAPQTAGAPETAETSEAEQGQRNEDSHEPANTVEPTTKSEPKKPTTTSSEFPLEEPDLTDANEKTLWATYYYLPQVTSTDGGFALLDMKGKELGPTLSQRDWCNSAMEGSVRVIDKKGSGTTYNYAGTAGSSQVDCSPYFDYDVSRTRFQKAKGEFGDGVRNYRLIPFRTVAVDPTVIPYGTILYIPQARGRQVTLPDGTTALHDGYFFAGDTGGLIKQNHIDVFIGVAKSNPFSWISSSQSGTFTAYVVSNVDAKTLLDARHQGSK